MLEGMLAALALSFGMPAEPAPAIVLEMGGIGRDPNVLEHCDFVWVTLKGRGAFTVRTSGLYGRVQSWDVTARDLPARLRLLAPAKGERCSRAYVRAEADIAFSEVLRTIAIIRHNGFDRIGLVSEDEPA